MGKIRVHELAKEFGLENREVIKCLQAAGISVKTHSSSVYEDEARAALRKTAAPDKPKKVRKRPGMIIRKKKATDPDVAAAEGASEEAEASSDEPAETAAATASGDQSVEAPAEAAEAAETAVEESAAEAAEVAEAAEPFEAAAEATEAQPAAAASEASEASEAAAEATESAVDAQPAQKGKSEGEQKPTGARVVRMIDREKLMERVPSRRLGISNREDGPGRSFGRVTELKVVNDPFGRGREMVQVGRDRRGRKTVRQDTRGGARGKRGGGRQYRERAMFPARLKKKKSGKSGGKIADVSAPMKESKRVIKMKETIQLADLAHQLGVKAVELIRKLMGLGIMVTQNENLDFETAQLLATDYEFTVESIAFTEDEVLPDVGMEEVDDDDLVDRSPVVTVMGHVDHGKTSILDAIRKTRVAAGEAGGITQHIGAYSVTLPKKGSITFLDTPGHAAFTEMRARGAQVTDIVVLVVAADDGVMPQTEEAIHHAQDAGVPIIVAINKMDKPEANPDRVTQELSKFSLLPEDWGGDTLFVRTSATKGDGLDDLLETILLQAEVLELKAHDEVNAVGVVVEAKLDKGRGPVATILVQHGHLTRGDHVVVGEHCGKIRAMTDHTGKQVKEAGPSDAVEIIGLEGVPNAGDPMNMVDGPEEAKKLAGHRLEQRKGEDSTGGAKMSLDDLMKRMAGDEALELKIVLKGDVQGSVEAVKASLLKLSTEEVEVSVIASGVGAVTESDIMLASASGGLVIGFNVRPDGKARQIAEREGVEIRTYTIIYELLDEVRKAMEGLLSPESKEKVLGRAEVREVFRISKVGQIAGCRVVDGKAVRSARVRVLRDSVQVYEGKVSSLKHFKDDVREVEQGLECGCGVEGFNDIKQGDALEFFEIEEVARTLGDSPKRPAGGVEAHP